MELDVLRSHFGEILLKTAISDKTRTYSNLNLLAATKSARLLVSAEIVAVLRTRDMDPFLIIPVLRFLEPQQPDSGIPDNSALGTPVQPQMCPPPQGHFYRTFDGFACLPTHGRRKPQVSGKFYQFYPRKAEKADSGRGESRGDSLLQQVPPPTGLSPPHASVPRKSGLGTRGGIAPAGAIQVLIWALLCSQVPPEAAGGKKRTRDEGRNSGLRAGIQVFLRQTEPVFFLFLAYICVCKHRYT